MFLRMPSNYKVTWKDSQLVQVEAHEYIHILFSMLNLLSFVYKKRFLKNWNLLCCKSIRIVKYYFYLINYYLLNKSLNCNFSE